MRPQKCARCKPGKDNVVEPTPPNKRFRTFLEANIRLFKERAAIGAYNDANRLASEAQVRVWTRILENFDAVVRAQGPQE